MKAIILTLTLTLAAIPALADSVRCRGEIIENGMSKFVVLKKCGKPDTVNVIGSTTVKNGSFEVARQTEEWIYEQFDYGDDYIITIVGSTVSSVKRLD